MSYTLVANFSESQYIWATNFSEFARAGMAIMFVLMGSLVLGFTLILPAAAGRADDVLEGMEEEP